MNVLRTKAATAFSAS